MGLPERLAEVLKDLGQEKVPAPEPGVDPYTYWKVALDKHRKSAISLEAQNESLKAAGARMLSELGAVAQTLRQSPPGIDELIDSLLKIEIERRGDLPMSEHPDPVFDLPQLTQAEKMLGATVKARYEKALRTGLALLRDTRWDLMALRAEFEDPGDAPVFDNSADLQHFLQAVLSDDSGQD